MITKANKGAAKRATLFLSKIDLPEETRRRAVEVLNGRLALALDLALQAKQAHWNVKGPSFESLHGLFDDVAKAALGFADHFAERAVQLGGLAEGTLQVIGERSSLPAYPLDAFDGRAHVEALSGAVASFGRHVRTAIQETADLGDDGTSDLFTQVSRATDELLWRIEAHGQADR